MDLVAGSPHAVGPSSSSSSSVRQQARKLRVAFGARLNGIVSGVVMAIGSATVSGNSIDTGIGSDHSGSVEAVAPA
jgi:hypothetical protein